MLCGSMFDRPIERHRHFEANFRIAALKCDHVRQWLLWPDGFTQRTSRADGRPARVISVFGRGGGEYNDLETWGWAMGIDWMTKKKALANSCPPVYAQYIGQQLRHHLAREACTQRDRRILQASS